MKNKRMIFVLKQRHIEWLKKSATEQQISVAELIRNIIEWEIFLEKAGLVVVKRSQKDR